MAASKAMIRHIEREFAVKASSLSPV